MKKISLRSIYLFMLTVVFLISFLAFVLFDLNSQKQQAEAALLEESRTFAREMGAVWTFMDNSQKVINTSADGDYDFKRLHCSIVGKSGELFFPLVAITKSDIPISIPDPFRTSLTSTRRLPWRFSMKTLQSLSIMGLLSTRGRRISGIFRRLMSIKAAWSVTGCHKAK